MDTKSITRTVYKVNDFLSWQRSGSLILSPSFQRRSVWSKSAKSYFIDTVVRGFPVPIVFLRERTDLKSLEPQREVVDGQQRLRTLISFIEPDLLEDFDPKTDEFKVSKQRNPDIAGRVFAELDPKIRQRILNYEFSVQTLPSDTDDREVLQIFARMNSTGLKLNHQEIRNSQFFGGFKSVAYNLSYEQLNRWRDWKIYSETDIARMLEVEGASDLILMMLEGLHGKSQPALNNLYKRYDDEFPQKSQVRRRFRHIMDKLDESLGMRINDLVFSRKTLFHTLFTFYYDLAFDIGSSLGRTKPTSIPAKAGKCAIEASHRITHGDLSDDLRKVLRGATGNLQSRVVRLEFLQDVYRNVKA